MYSIALFIVFLCNDIRYAQSSVFSATAIFKKMKVAITVGLSSFAATSIIDAQSQVVFMQI